MKKILALCITVMLVLAMVPVIGAAAADKLTLTVGSGTANIGETVKIAVSIAGNETNGLSSVKFDIGYNADVFELIPFVNEWGEEAAGENLNHGGIEAAFGPATNNPVVVNWAHGTRICRVAGDVAILTFKVKDGAAVGKYPFEVSVATVFVAKQGGGTTPIDDYTVVAGEIEVVCEHGTTEPVAGKDATCTETGLTEGEVCSLCGEVIVEQEVIPTVAHTEVTEGAVEPTCTEAGNTGTTTCSVCGEVIADAEVIDALGHKEEIVNAKDATCLAPGYTGDTVCSVCGEVIAEGEEIPQLEHEWKPVEKVDPTCTTEGMEAHFACGNGCGGLQVEDEEGNMVDVTADDLAIAMIPHNLEKVDGVAATEEKEGIKEHYKCTECGALFADAEGETAIDAEDVIIPAIEKAPENADPSDKAPATNDLVNMFVVVAMLLAAAATVVVLKKKA